MSDKHTEQITFKVPPRIKIQLEEAALDRGVNLSDLCRKWVIRSLHNSKFRMRDYLNSTEEEQGK